MKVTVRLEITREDGGSFKEEHCEQILQQLQSDIEGIGLEDLVKYEGTSREETVSLSISCEEIDEGWRPATKEKATAAAKKEPHPRVRFVKGGLDGSAIVLQLSERVDGGGRRLWIETTREKAKRLSEELNELCGYPVDKQFTFDAGAIKPARAAGAKP